MLRAGGTVIFNGEQKAVELASSWDSIRRDITAAGLRCHQLREFQEIVALWRSGFNVADLSSHRISFGEATGAYQLFAAGATAKVLLT